ncbi:MAG: 6-phosphofructokinase, partial [Candidatus Eisenbacteria bacterium]|nr:6-phosphofructokinase [Candidatus Eisenbacteria bacterium]
MASKWKIGILTGGGDVPGLNSCIRAFTYRALDDGHEVIGIRRGWRGVANLNPDNPPSLQEWLVPLSKIQVRTVDRAGGTFLHTSRTNPARIKRRDLPRYLEPQYPPKEGAEPDPDERFDITPHVLRALEKLAITHLVVIGGDDTLSYAARLNREQFPVVAIPKTMDNDVMGTDYCIGFSTAVSRSVNLITELRTPVGSHERIGVVEVFGRYSGETALFSGYLASVDRTLISEVPFDLDRVAELICEDKAANPSKYAMLAISEGAKPIGGDMILGGEEDAFGHRKLGGISDIVGLEIKRRTGQAVMVQRLSYLMRSGAPDSLDRMVAYSYGNLAYELIAGGQRGQMVA